MKMPCSPRRSNPWQTGLFCVCFVCGLIRQSSKIGINTKVSSFNTLYQNCLPRENPNTPNRKEKCNTLLFNATQIKKCNTKK